MTTEAEQFRRDVIVLFARASLRLKEIDEQSESNSPEQKEAMVGVLADLLAGYTLVFTYDQLQSAFGKPGSKLN